jgi:ATP-dependent protease ClpP protease subunit
MATAALNFHGPIQHPATTKLRNALCSIANERSQDAANAGKRKFNKLCLFISSSGGSLDDGVSLFGFMRSLPLEITTINTGLIASIAILPFLAGKVRIATPHSRFHFHDFEWNYPAAHNLTRLEYVDHTQILNSARQNTLEILKANTALTDKDFEELKLLVEPTIKDTAFAKEKGIVHEVNYFPFTDEMNVFNVEY